MSWLQEGLALWGVMLWALGSGCHPAWWVGQTPEVKVSLLQTSRSWSIKI